MKLGLNSPAQNRERPFRIVSLVPSLTETICDLGLRESLVGCTSFCIEPPGLHHSVPSVGGTKDADFDRIAALAPTHVIVNDEENTVAMRTRLRAESRGWEVVDTFPIEVDDVLPMLQMLGKTFNVETAASAWRKKLEAALQSVRSEFAGGTVSACYFIWRDPWMVAGDRTFIAKMLELAGIKLTIRTAEALAARYPVVDSIDPRISAAQALLFSSEPYPFRQRHIDEFNSISANRGVSLKVDGQLLSWFGTRAVAGVQYVRSLRTEIDTLLRSSHR